jgi:uncharacterized membrane protein YccC
MAEPTLRSVGAPPPLDLDDGPEAPPSRPGRGRSLALLVALAVAIALLLWSRIELSRTTRALEGEIQALRVEVSSLRSELGARDLLIDAQRERLDRVRDQLQALQRLLAEPYPEFGS